MTSAEPTIAEVGESGIIARVARPPRHPATLLGSGDDAAIVAARHGRAVVSTDILVEGEHFRLDWSDPYSIGRRAIAQNAADIEAMGAHPTGYVVAIAAPRGTPAHVIAGIGDGAVAEAERSGADVVGGDFSASQQLVVCVTALGQFAETMREPVLQNGARPGDVVAIAGTLGWSAAGLDILSGAFGDYSTFRSYPLVQRACDLYRCPQPPYGFGARAAAAGASAMTDVSDGLLVDLRHIIWRSREKMAENRPEYTRQGPCATAHTGAAALRNTPRNAPSTVPSSAPVEATSLVIDLSYQHVLAVAGEPLAELAALCATQCANWCAGQTGEQTGKQTGAQSAQTNGAAAILRRWILTGGEDHGLLATFPPERELPDGFRPIGTVRAVAATDSNSLISIDGSELPAVDGWESFTSTAHHPSHSHNQ